MGKYKNYKAIYEILSRESDEKLKAIFQAYVGGELKGEPSGMQIDWAMEVVSAMATSDGLTDEEIDKVFTEQGLI